MSLLSLFLSRDVPELCSFIRLLHLARVLFLFIYFFFCTQILTIHLFIYNFSPKIVCMQNQFKFEPLYVNKYIVGR